MADLAAGGDWAQEYLAAEARGKAGDWSQEFIANRLPPGSQPAQHMVETPWAQDFLAQNEHKVW